MLKYSIVALVVLGLALFALLQIERVQDNAICWVTTTFYTPHKQGDASADTPLVHARSQTLPVANPCDAADDPAIWVNKEKPAASLVIGTNKRRGLAVYNLQGQQLSSIRLGAANNVDLRTVISAGGEQILVGTTLKDVSEIRLLSLNPDTGSLSELNTPINTRVEQETYGFCLYLSHQTNQLFAIATDKSGQIEQWRLTPSAQGGYEAELARILRVDSQPEGCVADDIHGYLYVGEEARGIWRFSAEPEGDATGVLIAQAGEVLGEGVHLYADVEGLALYSPSGQPAKGYLIASSQGNDTYAVFDRSPPHAFRGVFQIALDGYRTGDTDGLEVSALTLGPAFPEGLLVVQDGAPAWQNRHNQNFKLVSWSDIAQALQLDR